MKDVINHYDLLIDEGNDPVHDPKPLKDYMNKWDGQRFMDCMMLNSDKSVLEIGVGTGRIAMKVAPLCHSFLGIDISPKTIARAEENLSANSNVRLVCGDFMTFDFLDRFDVVYSSLTFMHIQDKQAAIQKAASLLKDKGLFVLSMDKNRSECIDMGTRKIKIYPDDPIRTRQFLEAAELIIKDSFETAHAHVVVAKKASM